VGRSVARHVWCRYRYGHREARLNALRRARFEKAVPVIAEYVAAALEARCYEGSM